MAGFRQSKGLLDFLLQHQRANEGKLTITDLRAQGDVFLRRAHSLLGRHLDG